MPQFSKRSIERLGTCHSDLQRLMHEVIRHMDVTILCGHRGKEEQDAAYKAGTSKLKWPNGQHNKTPALAVDVAPWPVDWKDIGRFEEMGEFIKRTAAEMGIKITWGGDWKMRDYPHVELAE